MVDILIAIIGAYILGWVAISFIHYLDRRSATKRRKLFELKLAAEGRTLAQFNEEMAISRFEHECNKDHC